MTPPLISFSNAASRTSAAFVVVALSLVTLGLAACAPAAPAASVAPDAPATPSAQSQYIEDAAAYAFPTPVIAIPTPTPEPAADADQRTFVTVSTGGARANLRNAPNLNGVIIAKGNAGTTYEVIGRTGDGEWYQICCVSDAERAAAGTTGDTAVETVSASATASETTTATSSITLTVGLSETETVTDAVAGAAAPVADVAPPNSAWVAASVVSVGGEAADVAVVAAAAEEEALLPDDLTATWDVAWECGSDRERCKLQECAATVTAAATGPSGGEWLPIDHTVAWDEACSEFPPDQWTFEIDRFTGAERTGEFDDKFLYSYWVGADAGEFNGVYTLDDGRHIAVWCSGPYKVELNEGNGWTSVYQGNTCHDVRTGMLVLLSYTKRWLYTGEFDGNTYDKAYFGDNETLVQRLSDTNVEMAEVVPAQ